VPHEGHRQKCSFPDVWRLPNDHHMRIGHRDVVPG
jgi:hypothetical protein